MRILSCAQMRQAERYSIDVLKIPGQILMENAGRAVADFVLERFSHDLFEKRIAVVCAKGNNAGDGFVAARRLLGYGALVQVILMCDPADFSPDAAVMYDKLRCAAVTILPYTGARDAAVRAVLEADVVIDALFGTGFHGQMPERFDDIVAAVQAGAGLVVSVDVPSGVNADDGSCAKSCITADVTICFQYAKLGLYLPDGYLHCGDIRVADIGIAESELDGERVWRSEESLIASLLPQRAKDANKGSFGRVLCVAGSEKMPGAAVMAASSAVTAGAGTLVMAIPQSLYYGMSARVSEAMILPLPEKDGALGRESLPQLLAALPEKGALLVGPGLSQTPEVDDVLTALIENCQAPMLIDADGINALSRHIDSIKKAQAPVVLTPHPGEMARLCGTSVAAVQADRIGTAREFARRYGVTLLLKGANTVIACTNGEVYLNPTGNPAMAKGGSGDVLAGVAAAFLAQGMSADAAAVCAAYIHGLAGDELVKNLSDYSVTPSHMIGEIGRVLGRF